ncbi:Glutathione S-transferase-like protein gedE [Lachnellula cervina]|uniref:glutathione transferase n=1 Tax=Lachnellula cervina TaxID=1316786 RepID=A0A7D8URV4_9HELO|nr:Glutathione S-transferase-like protein gedE [Lachnellula cervina]
MTTPLKPLTLWGGVGGPNPSKVSIILTELSLAFESQYLGFDKLKTPEYLKLNPNGRLPTLVDPNNGDFTIWESGAIIEYVIAKYDKNHLLSYEVGSDLDFQCKQWLHFQVSGQGPYYGQAYWFANFHPEKLPSAIERYVKEVKRVSGVLDSHLKDREYLVGDKCTYADLAFISWQTGIKAVTAEIYDEEKEFPHLSAWLKRITSREATSRVLEQKKALEATFFAKK